MSINKHILPFLLFVLATDATIISQMPPILENHYNSILYLSWIPPFTIILFSIKNVFEKYLFPYLLFIFAFAFYCLLCEAFSGLIYIKPGGDLNNIAISFFILIISYVYWRKRYITRERLNFLLLNMLVSALVVSIEVYYDSFAVGFDIMSRQYAFQAKNSLSLILLFVALISFLNYRPHSKIYRTISVLLSFSFIILIFMMKARATLVGLAFVVFHISFLGKQKTMKKIILILSITLVIIVISSDQIYNVIVNGILLGSRDANNVDDLSSGRMSLMSDLLGMYDGHEFFGIGAKYMDCFPIVILVQYGIIGATLVFGFLFYVFKKQIVRLNKNDNFQYTVFLLFLVAMINSLFEAYSPFGPGVKCFLLWMFLGFVLAERKNNIKYITL